MFDSYLLWIVFLALAALAIWTHFFRVHLYVFTKGLPVAYLILAYLLGWESVPPKWEQLALFVFVGLCLGFLGDLFLLRRNMFLPGLAAFLAGHVFYAAGFSQAPWTVRWWAIVLFLPAIFAYGIYLTRYLREHNRENYIIPVWFYVTGIYLMFINGLNMELFLARPVPWFFFGAILFVVSDAILAWNRFIREVRGAQLYILGTYYLSQICIVRGIVELH